ncbi:MAG TPA: FG-GAP repeat protein [Micromonospora sp.]|nr:FG-GAP repeat protein [Micromonospora sp.]
MQATFLRRLATAVLTAVSAVAFVAAAPALGATSVEQPASHGDPPLPEYPGLPLSDTLQTFATVNTTPVPCDNNGADKFLTRSQVLTRARSWLAVGGVPYSQARCYRNSYGDYRTDCSGFVSMAWGLGGSGSAFWTGNLMNRAFQVSRSALKPGDALLRHTGDPSENHVALFVKWADSDRTQPLVIEQTGSSGTIERTWSASYASLYTPIRYDNVIDGDSGDIFMMYDHGDGVASVQHFTPSGNSFVKSKSWEASGYHLGNVGNRVVTGDFNGDGREDVATAYDYGSGAARIHVWLNGSNYQGSWWSTTSGYNLGNVAGRMASGDFDGDGKDDIAMMYGYANGHTKIHIFKSTGSSFTSSTAWEVESGYNVAPVGDRLTAGDFNGDGKDDLATAYDYGSGAARIHVWLNGSNYQGGGGWWSTTSGYTLNNVDGRMS